MRKVVLLSIEDNVQWWWKVICHARHMPAGTLRRMELIHNALVHIRGPEIIYIVEK